MKATYTWSIMSYQSKRERRSKDRWKRVDFVRVSRTMSGNSGGICSRRVAASPSRWTRCSLPTVRVSLHTTAIVHSVRPVATCLCFIEMRYGQHRVTLAAPLTDNAWPRPIHEIARSRRISDATASLYLSVYRLSSLSLSFTLSLFISLSRFGTFVPPRKPLTSTIS